MLINNSTLLENHFYHIKASLHPNILNITVISIKDSLQFTAQIYSDLKHGSLFMFFQNLSQIVEYLKEEGNTRIDFQEGSLEIVGKGVTQKAKNVTLAKLKLNQINTDNSNSRAAQINQDCQSDNWTDALADNIIQIFQNNPNFLSIKQNLLNLVTKSELQVCLEEIRNQIHSQFSNMKAEIKQMNESHLSVNMVSMQKQIQSCYEAQNKRQNQVSNQILIVRQRIQDIQRILAPKQQTEESEINDEWSSLSHIIKKDIESQVELKFDEICNKLVSRQQTDVIINKIQSLGSKLENFIQQNGFKIAADQMSEVIRLQDLRISEIQEKLGDDQSPRKTLKNNLLSPSDALKWVDSNCSHFGRIVINNSLVSLVSFGGAHIFSKQRMMDKCCFHIHLSSVGPGISIGIIDSQYRYKMWMGQEQSHRIVYKENKSLWAEKIEKLEQGLGYNSGETITVSLDMELGTIMWKVQKELRFSWQSDSLRNKKIQWVPYIFLQNKSDCIQVLQ